MKSIKLTNQLTKQVHEFKPYLIGELPNSFDKNKTLHFKKNGITYIEKTESFWNSCMSVLGKLIVNCPRYGKDEYIVNTEVAEHVLDADIKRILKFYSDEVVIDFEEIC